MPSELPHIPSLKLRNIIGKHRLASKPTFSFMFFVFVFLYSFFIIRFARVAIDWYFRPFVLYWRALMYAAYTPFLLIVHVFFLQIGNDFFDPKKHFLPHLFSINVFWCVLGFCCFHFRQGTFFLVLVCVFVVIIL